MESDAADREPLQTRSRVERSGAVIGARGSTHGSLEQRFRRRAAALTRSGDGATRARAALEPVRRPEAAGTLGCLSAVAEQSLHRALGLTDWEFARIGELLGRAPNDFELAVFSVLWSEHCGYKHSAPLLRRLPSSGRARAPGPGRERGRRRPRRGARGRVQGRVAQPPDRGRALPGRRDRGRRHPARHRRHGSAPDRAARRPPLRRPRLALPPRGRRASASTETRSASPPSAARRSSTPAYADNPLVNAMCVGLLPTERVLRAKATRDAATPSCSTAR